MSARSLAATADSEPSVAKVSLTLGVSHSVRLTTSTGFGELFTTALVTLPRKAVYPFYTPCTPSL
jgi:hypothetical protein